jgi:hypothetical protein
LAAVIRAPIPLFGLLLMSVSCGGSSPSAADLCRSAGLTHAYAATPTHVGNVRSLRLGVVGAGTPAPHATSFPGHRDADRAAWCWVEREGAYRAYAVTTKEDPVSVAVYEGLRKHRPAGAPSRFGGTK